MICSSIASKLNINEADLQGIKNIVLDLGGVILNVHFEATTKAFEQLKFPDFKKVMQHLKESNVFDQFETGHISPQSFHDEMRKFKANIHDSEIDYAWNRMIGDIPTKNIELLRKLKDNYHTFLLSNTNIIHIHYLQSQLQQQYGEHFFSQLFDHIFYSYEMGCRKPNPEAYQFVLEKAGILAKETLFIDDMKENIEAARKLGIIAYHLQDEILTDLFDLNNEKL